MTADGTPARGLFIGQRRDRMGARLLMMLTCMRLADDFDTSYRVNWFPKNADAPELDTPEELFAADWMAAHFIADNEVERLENTALPAWHFKSDPSPARLHAHLAAGKAVIVEEGFEVFAFPWEDPEEIRTRYQSYIHTIAFTPMIAGEMDKIRTALAGKRSCAYHIRRGDILNGLPWKHSIWRAKIEPEEYYHSHIKTLNGGPAIMFSDQPETLAAFKRDYPALGTIQDITDLSGMTRAQRDFLELYAISCADHVVAPIISAFSMAAARLSGRERETFTEALPAEEVTAANNALIDRLKSGTKQFLSVSEQAHLYSKAHQHLTATGRFEEAYDIGKDILANGADNAFMPIFQALNCLYLGHHLEGQEIAEAGLENPHLWPEDFAVLSALLGTHLAARRKNWGAGIHFARAFWAKPLRPDVVVLGSRMVYRNQIAARLFPPVDWALLKHIRQRWYPPFNNLYLVQHRLMKRRPCNWDMVLLDWHELAVDQKARRLFQDKTRMEALLQALEMQDNTPPSDPAFQSLELTIKTHLGGKPQRAIDTAKRISSAAPDNLLYRKRLADLYEAAGDHTAALMEWSDLMAAAPENPFILATMAQFLDRAGRTEDAAALTLEAARHDVCSAAIQGAAGQILLKREAFDEAVHHLQKAQALYPTFNRFKNQLSRAQQKSETGAMARAN